MVFPISPSTSSLRTSSATTQWRPSWLRARWIHCIDIIAKLINKSGNGKAYRKPESSNIHPEQFSLLRNPFSNWTRFFILRYASWLIGSRPRLDWLHRLMLWLRAQLLSEPLGLLFAADCCSLPVLCEVDHVLIQSTARAARAGVLLVVLRKKIRILLEFRQPARGLRRRRMPDQPQLTFLPMFKMITSFGAKM